MDNEVLKWIAGSATAALGAAVGWVYKGTNGRIDKVEAELAKKADEDEMVRQRKHVEQLFEKHEELRKDMNGGFSAIREDMHKAHLDLIERLPRG